MEQRIVKKKKKKKRGTWSSLNIFFKLVGAFSVIYPNLPLTRCGSYLKFQRNAKGKNQQLDS